MCCSNHHTQSGQMPAESTPAACGPHCCWGHPACSTHRHQLCASRIANCSCCRHGAYPCTRCAASSQAHLVIGIVALQTCANFAHRKSGKPVARAAPSQSSYLIKLECQHKLKRYFAGCRCIGCCRRAASAGREAAACRWGGQPPCCAVGRYVNCMCSCPTSLCTEYCDRLGCDGLGCT